jgi:putative hydrolase of the HAD superfamily
MRTIEAVLFDFGGTLDADGVRWGVRFHAAYREAGGGLSLGPFEEVFRDVDRHMGRLSGVAKLGFRAMVDLQCRLLLNALPDGGGLPADRISATFHDDAVTAVRRNTPLLASLAARWPLGIVSNFTGNLGCCLAELGLAPFFQVVLDSGVEGREKPDPEMFLTAHRRLGTGAAGTWMVGDNPEADIRPSLALGMPACWLADPGRLPPPGVVPTARIARLADLEAALEATCTA